MATLITDTAPHVVYVPEIGEDFYFVRDLTFLYPERATVGADVGFHQGCFVNAYGGLVIGEGSRFGPGVMIHTTDHDHAGDDWKNEWVMRPVEIGCDVHVGMGAILCPGAAVGDHAVVGAGAVVRGRVESGAVVVGNPARRVG